MGGPGSGPRENPVKKLAGLYQPAAIIENPTIELPNYSGVQDAALKTRPPLSTGGAETDPVFAALSGAFAMQTYSAELSGLYAVTSGAYIAHAADASDPHGATLTQTNLIITSGNCSADITASGSAVFRNILIGTEASGALTASAYPQGTIYLKYT